MGNSDLNSIDTSGTMPHLVTLTHDFWLAKTEVTLEQWQKVMGKRELHPKKTSPFLDSDPHYPMVSISYYDIQRFLKELEKLSPDNHFRLPTEAEWEYACRAGTTTPFSTGTRISAALANFNAEIPSSFCNSEKNIGHTSAVASYPPNSWGLYDMHGNVWEWVSDWYEKYTAEPLTDPLGPISGTLRVIRGGSWFFGADNVRSFIRKTHEPDLWGFSIGFRIVREKKK